MDIDIGIQAEDREASANALSKLLADTYTLYLKTHGYHWNVEGPHFQQLHALFMEQYTEMWTASDELAERIRALGFYAPGAYTQMAKLASLSEDAGDPPDWQTMVKTLAKGHEQVAKTAREVLRVAEEAGDDATADVVAPRVTLHEKTAWMLRATAS
ncbi:MAG: DNA starvation/stationary phase protection protein [Pseudomonadota bacterium]